MVLLCTMILHHPTEIKASLKSLRGGNPRKKIICLFEIRSNSMIAQELIKVN